MRSASLLLISGLLTVACGKKEQQAKEQAAKEAMQLVCDSHERSEAKTANPADRQMKIASWVAKQVTNPEIRALFDNLGELPPSQRQQAIRAAAHTHGIESCALIASLSPPLPLPEITLGGALEMEPGSWMIVVTPNAIVVEGNSVIGLTNGVVDPAQLERNGIPRLTQYFEAVKKQGGSLVALAIDPALSYRVLLAVLISAKAAKLDRVQFLVNRRGVMSSIPVQLPKLTPPQPEGAPATAPESVPLGLVVALSHATLTVWSLSGLEGTLDAPKLTLPVGDRPDLAPLVRALEEILQRRHGASEVLVKFDSTATIQTVATVLAAVRATDDKELFPELLLGAGVE